MILTCLRVCRSCSAATLVSSFPSTENVTATLTACTMCRQVNLLMADFGQWFMLCATGVV